MTSAAWDVMATGSPPSREMEYACRHPSRSLSQEKVLAVIHPIEPAGVPSLSSALGHIHPRGIVILEDGFRRSGSGIGDENRRRILLAIELADRHGYSVRHPIHAEDVMVARIARNLNPSRCAALLRNGGAQPSRCDRVRFRERYPAVALLRVRLL